VQGRGRAVRSGGELILVLHFRPALNTFGLVDIGVTTIIAHRIFAALIKRSVAGQGFGSISSLPSAQGQYCAKKEGCGKCLPNTGQPMFFFNHIQRTPLPACYRPLAGNLNSDFFSSD